MRRSQLTCATTRVLRRVNPAGGEGRPRGTPPWELEGGQGWLGHSRGCKGRKPRGMDQGGGRDPLADRLGPVAPAGVLKGSGGRNSPFRKLGKHHVGHAAQHRSRRP